MDFRKQIRRHPAHRSVMRRMRPRRDFVETVAPLTEEEEREFAALQTSMAMRLVMHKMQPQPSGEAAIGAHEHLPRFTARADRSDVRPQGWSPAALAGIGMLTAAALLATVCGLVLAF